MAIENLFKFNTMEVQSYSSFILYIGLAVIFGLVMIFVIWKLYQMKKYNIHITFHKKLGNASFEYEDWAREFKEDDGFYFKFKGINKMCPQWPADYQTIVKKKSFFGLINKSFVGYHLFQYDKKIVPMMVHSNPGIVAFDMDLFNFMQGRIKTNIRKYQKTSWLVQMAPLIGLGLVVFMFIVGMIFYGQHIEKVAEIIIGGARGQATEIIRSAGIQNIPGA